MIAIESFKRFRAKDIVVIIFAVVLWMVMSLLLNKIFVLEYAYVYSLFAMGFVVAFILLLLRKALAALLFYMFGGLLTLGVDDIGVVGGEKLIVLFVVALVFEAVFIILKLEVKSVPLDVVFSTSLSLGMIPIMDYLLLASDMLLLEMDVLPLVFNMFLLSTLAGLLGSVSAFLLWYRIRTQKWVLRFNYTY